MYLHLDHHSGEPIYRQLIEQIKYRIACGQLAPGSQLPSIRALASELKINPRTVVKAYEELDHAGLVIMKQGQGVFIASDRSAAPAGERRRVIGELARRMFAEADRLGASPEEVLEIAERIARQMEATP